MSGELIIVVAIGLIFGLPIALIFWANIYVMARDILASGIEAPSGVETGNTDSTEGESQAREAGDAQ